MRNCMFIMLVVLGLTGCGASPTVAPEYGQFLPKGAPANLNETLVADTVKQLMALYPPASTRLDMAHPASDSFGTKLVQSLRQNGYALFESTTPSAAPGMGLRYVLDSPFQDFYRVTVLIGSQSLSRAYERQNEVISPAGAWARKE